jgi:hypothetical protein
MRTIAQLGHLAAHIGSLGEVCDIHTCTHSENAHESATSPRVSNNSGRAALEGSAECASADRTAS